MHDTKLCAVLFTSETLDYLSDGLEKTASGLALNVGRGLLGAGMKAFGRGAAGTGKFISKMPRLAGAGAGGAAGFFTGPEDQTMQQRLLRTGVGAAGGTMLGKAILPGAARHVLRRPGSAVANAGNRMWQSSLQNMSPTAGRNLQTATRWAGNAFKWSPYGAKGFLPWMGFDAAKGFGEVRGLRAGAADGFEQGVQKLDDLPMSQRLRYLMNPSALR